MSQTPLTQHEDLGAAVLASGASFASELDSFEVSGYAQWSHSVAGEALAALVRHTPRHTPQGWLCSCPAAYPLAEGLCDELAWVLASFPQPR